MRPQGDLESRDGERAGSAAGKICPLHGPAGSIPGLGSTDSECCGHGKSIPEVSTGTDTGHVMVTQESRHLEHHRNTELLTSAWAQPAPGPPGHSLQQALLESAFPEEEIKDFWRLMSQAEFGPGGPSFPLQVAPKAQETDCPQYRSVGYQHPRLWGGGVK